MQLEKTKQSAWTMLTPDEKVSLDLSIVNGKSSWKAGEIMGKAHYKYLEIQKRAIHLMKLFNSYLELTNNYFIPARSVCPMEFQEYIQLVIAKRLPVKAISANTKTEILLKSKDRNKLILDSMRKLERSNVPGDKDLAEMIKEFDSWNSHRILPPEIQAPSAYKRRTKHKAKKLIKLAYSLSESTIEGIKQIYGIKTRVSPTNSLLVPILRSPKVNDIMYIPIHKNHIKNITELHLYVFTNHFDAEAFIINLKNYLVKEKKHCRDGQIFWPRFRETAMKAVNYKDIENLQTAKKISEMSHRKTDRTEMAARGLHT